MPQPIKNIEIEGKKFTIIDISDEIESDKNLGNKLSNEEKLRIFKEKIPNIGAFKNLKVEGFLEEINQHFWAFEDDTFGIIIYPTTFPCLHIEDINIGIEFRGVGIGTILFDYIESIAKENHYRCITVDAISNYPIIKFWRTNGFYPSSEMDSEYIVPLLEKLDYNISITENSDLNHRHIIPMVKNFPHIHRCPTGIWRFTHDIINNMQRLVDETERWENEYGAALEGQFIKNGSIANIELGNICIGETCGVTLTGKANPEKVFIGEFHTHVLDEDDEIMMSDSDIRRMDKFIRGVSCIGGKAVNRNERIKCYIHKPGQLTEDRIKERHEELLKIENMPFQQQYSEWKKIIQRDFIEFNPYNCLE